MQPQHPPEHAVFLARRDFVIPPGVDFTPAERELLAKYGRWLEALASGAIAPATPGQEQFVQVARGEREPGTDFERAWVKVIRQRAIAVEVVRTFQSLAKARADNAALEAEYLAARAAVLAQVREQLDAVDMAYAERLKDAADGSAATEQAVRDLVLRLGRSVWLVGIRATYASPRVSWDNARMELYARHHPEVKAFRKVGKPTVALRFMDKPAEPVPDASTLPAENNRNEAMKALPPEGGE